MANPLEVFGEKPGRGVARGDIKLTHIFSSDKGDPLS